jgi:transcriptional regulator with XRE-family HTH domain
MIIYRGVMRTKELLGARIKELRKTKRLTQEELSEMVDIDPKHLSRIEVGRSYPSLDALERMAIALDVELKDFFEFEHQAKSQKELKEKLNKLLKDVDIDKFRLALKVIRAISR